MAGNVEGGKKTAAVIKQTYGADFYRHIGRLGGIKSRGGGFAYDREWASKMGRIGGKKSRGGGFAYDREWASKMGRIGGKKSRRA